MSGDAVRDITLEDHWKAFGEVAFLMDIFTATIDNIMGGATAPVGRIAGREMAKKLPVHLGNPSLEEAMTVLASSTMNSGVCVGSVPAVVGTCFFAASDPAIASMPIASGKRAKNMQTPSSVL